MALNTKNKLFKRAPTFWLVLICFVVGVLTSQANNAWAQNNNWQQWAQHNDSSVEVIDHSIWNRILKTYVSTSAKGQNMFNYSAVSPADKRALMHYLEILSTTPVSSLNKNEQLAFWINAYNAIIVQAIIQSYPVESILDVDGDIFTRGPWKDNYFSVNGVPINLFNIRHNILFAHWGDIRVIYALSCGAISCPNIGAKAAKGKSVNGYLDAAAIAFINGPEAFKGFKGNSVKISQLFYWSKHQFKRENINMLDHIKSYALGELSHKLRNVDHIAGYYFNWQLNDLNEK